MYAQSRQAEVTKVCMAGCAQVTLVTLTLI